MTEVDNLNIFGERTKFIWELFKQYKNNHNVILQKSIRRALNSIHLYPTHSQIHELVHRACEINGRTPVDHLTFGEFAFLISELQQHYLNNSPAMTPRSQLKSKAVQLLEEKRIRRRFSHSSGFQVFLGGSCNPTTWRTDVAIPFLKKCGITYYNPQVCNWKPELMELEDQAKQTAELLLFVIDNQTRSTASMVEAAYIAGCGRQLILVIKRFQAPVFIYEEELRQSELEDLERSHAYLTDLVERMSIPVFSDLNVALNCAKKAILQQVKVSDLTVEDGSQPIKHPHVRVANELMSVKEVFNNVDTFCNGKLSFDDANFAFKTMTTFDLPPQLSSREYFTFENFCCLLSEFKYSRRKGFFQLLLSMFFYVPYRLLDWLGWWNQSRKVDVKRDVFLGGSCGLSKWRDDVAIPILRKHGVSYYNPQLDGWNTHCIPREAAIKDSCQVLLYVITEDTRAMTSLLEAGYFIGQGCNVVLCIKNMKYGVVIDNEQLTESAVNDYNRSRSYLADLANRDGIPVLDDIAEAVNCAVTRLKECRDSECLFS